MSKKNPNPHLFKRHSLPKIMRIGAVAGALTAMSNSVLADCDSTLEACKSSCHNSYAAETTDCAEDRNSKYDDCGSIWAQILMTREERDTCRALAYAEFEICVASAERERDSCKRACEENWEACVS